LRVVGKELGEFGLKKKLNEGKKGRVS